ncbi:hypothetical protein FLL45_10480 [Aliikangiella marina]|uniref:Chemotaxis protein n=1 Tax=Aliikangiella marina TaxID=1712262 RepID=A0A545TDQ4_9GAMM|nr:hypothetical protein [Aliikangiella marina]TQV75349.1 hypothetical protein FLL45_10480 [Aliikangiella marina]
MNNKQKAAETFISVANVASELSRAQSIAVELSIISKNARALAVRAGSTAAGFNEITRFIEGLSTLTIDAAETVSGIATTQTKSANELFRTYSLLAMLDTVQSDSEAEQKQQILPIYSRIQANAEKLKNQINSKLKELIDSLDETKLELRATQVVSVVSRVESVRASKDFQESLNSVADKVSNAGNRINQHLENARKSLIKLRP